MTYHLERLSLEHGPHLFCIFRCAFGKNHLPFRETHLFNFFSLYQVGGLLGRSWGHVLLDRESRRRDGRGGGLRQQVSPSFFAAVVLVVLALAEFCDLILARALRQIGRTRDKEESIHIVFRRSCRELS